MVKESIVTQSLSKGMKQTEIGLIPEDWEMVKIKEISSIKTGSKNTQDRIENGKYSFFVRSQTIERINSYSYDEEAVLTAGDGVGVGKVFHYVNEKFDLHQRVYLMHQFRKDVSGFYFFKYFQNNFLGRVMQMTAKSSVDSVRMETISEMPIPLPPLPEQKAIAAALSDCDAWIESLEAVIAKKRLIKQGAMQKLLTRKEDWEVKKLGEIAEFFKGRGLPKSQLDEGGELRCIHYGELFTKYRELIKSIRSRTNSTDISFSSKSNDVLMPTSDVTPRGLATASCIKEDGVILGGDILVIRFTTLIDGVFFSYFITNNKEEVLKYVSGSTVYHLYGSELSNLIFYFPKSLSEQTRIATVLSDMDAELEALVQKLNKARQIKQGMMQELLTGRVRLV